MKQKIIIENNENLQQQMEDDFILMCEVNNVDFKTVDYAQVEKDNLERFKKHLKEFGDISEFEYQKQVPENETVFKGRNSSHFYKVENDNVVRIENRDA